MKKLNIINWIVVGRHIDEPAYNIFKCKLLKNKKKYKGNCLKDYIFIK